MSQAPVQQDTSPAEAESPDPITVPPAAGDTTEKVVPVSEAIRYRKRAQAAEQSLTDLRTKLEVMKAQLDESNQTISHLERRQHIDALLHDSEAIDVEAARLLTEIAIESMQEPNVRAAVEDLRRQKPYLFRRRSRGVASAMPAHGPDTEVTQAEHLAEQAVQTGNRRDLLRYLRLRRKA